MKVIVAGGSGWIGRALCRSLLNDRHEVVVLSRGSGQPILGRRVVWDGVSLGAWVDELATADAVVNLSGESIGGGRWTAERKARLVNSRVDSTTILVEGMRQTGGPPVLVNASAVGYYGDRGDEELTEIAEPGSDFLARLVVAWEAAGREAEAAGVRVVLVRSGVVLGPGGGALRQLALPFRLFMGGPVGRSTAWFPWIHIDDEVGLFRHAIEDARAAGPINAVAGSVTMGQFARTMGSVLRRPSWLLVPRFALKPLLGELGDALTMSQHVVREAAGRLGYEFRQPSLEPALRRALLD